MKSEQAQVAAIIRKELKKHGIKARVRSKGTSMAVKVTILDDVCPKTREAIESYLLDFESGQFNGMADSYEYDPAKRDQLTVEFVHCHVEYSDEIKGEARALLEAVQHPMKPWEVEQCVWQVLNGSLFPQFWTSRKPRQRAA